MDMPDPVTPYTRLFVAWFPDPATRESLARYARDLADRYGGRALPAENLHITLRYIGRAGEVQLGCLRRLLSDLVAESFRLQFDRLEYRARQKMIWALPGDEPEALNRLATELEHGVSTCGLGPADHAFFPHITLVRNVIRKPVLGPLDIETEFDSLELVSSETLADGSRYSVVDRAVFSRP